MIETFTSASLPYFHWDGDEPLAAILVAGDATATCPPRARQWEACRQLVEALGGTVIARYAETPDADDARPCRPLAHLADDLQYGDGEARALVVFAPEVWDDGRMAVTAWMRELDVYYVHCPGGYRHPAMSAKLLEARWCRRQRDIQRQRCWRDDVSGAQRLYQYTRWWEGAASASYQAVDGVEQFGYQRALVDAEGYCRGRAPQETPRGQAVLMPVPEDILTIQAMRRAVWSERLGAIEIAQRLNAATTDSARCWTAARVTQVLLDDTLTRIGIRGAPIFQASDVAGLAVRLQDAAAWPPAGRHAVCYLRGAQTPHWCDVAAQRATCAHQATAQGVTLRRAYADLSGLDAYAHQHGWQALLDDLASGEIRPRMILIPDVVWAQTTARAQQELQDLCDWLTILIDTGLAHPT